ncbi:hypothetical protein ACTXT7_004819 [Hymenolepis weldensis]
MVQKHTRYGVYNATKGWPKESRVRLDILESAACYRSCGEQAWACVLKPSQVNQSLIFIHQ